MDEGQGHSRSNYDVFWRMPKIQTFIKSKGYKNSVNIKII